MLIEIKKKFAEAIGYEKFKPFGLNPDEWWRNMASRQFKLEVLSEEKIEALKTLLEGHKRVRGIKETLSNIEVYQQSQIDPDRMTPKNPQQFAVLLKAHLATVAGHRLYKHDPQYHDGVWLGYYVNDIEYHPSKIEGRGKDREYYPPYVTMDLLYQKYEQNHGVSVHFSEDECLVTPHKALLAEGYYVEREKFRTAYLEETKRFNHLVGSVGKQLLATGYGSDNIDGNPNKGSSWYYRTAKLIPLIWNDGPAKVVADVFNEGDEDQRRSSRNESKPDVNFWESAVSVDAIDDDDADPLAEAGEWEEDVQDKRAEIEVPMHPFMVVFDLHKHLRLKVHVAQLVDYVYEKNLAEKLVLPDDLKHLVKLLVESKGGEFADIVQGKSGGAIVLLAGKPGVGKTLTAEVFAEAEERPLYSVQCSQLGTNPNSIEDTLLKTFARAKRWNAVTLLDEADVYIHQRGNDLEQNAIVGVFLRVLEYQAKVLFLTTNRPNDVDDAIGSRCIAKLVYEAPNAEEQAKIWRVLADSAGIKIDNKAIKEIVKASDGLTGRDVKNLLKLGRLMAGKEGVTAAVIEQVKKFKPTT